MDSAAATQRRVRFSSVTTLTFDLVVDGSKLPSTGCAPLGLGHRLLARTDAEPLDEFESRRSALRRPAEGLLLGHVARLERLGDDLDTTVLAAVEKENAAIIGERFSSLGPAYGGGGDGDGGDGGDSGDGDINGLGNGAFGKLGQMYSTAEAGAERGGAGGGFAERQSEEEERRAARREEERAACLSRKAERRRCSGCRRFACIC